MTEQTDVLNFAQEQIRTLFAASQIGVALTTEEGKVLAANEALLQLMEYSEEKFLQQNVAQFYVDPRQRSELLKQLSETGTVSNFGVEVKKKDDRRFFANLNVSQVNRGGERILLALIEDVSDQIEVQNQLQQEISAREKVEWRLAEALTEVEDKKQGHLESERYYKMLLESTHDVVYSVTPEGIMTYIGPQTILFGYKPEELISKNFIAFVASEQRQDVIQRFKTRTAAGESFTIQFQWVNKDGSRTWIEAVGRTVFDKIGEPEQQIGVMRFMGERTKQEEEKEQLLVLLDILDAECFIKDQNGAYQYINRAFEEQFSVKRDEVVGQDDVFVFGAETAAMLKENDNRIMAAKKPESLEESTTLQNGQYVVYLTSKTPIIDENGEVSGICGAGVDITYQKKAEEQLRLSEEKYRNLVEQISEVIYSANLEGEIIFVSPAIEHFMGYRPDEVIGQPLHSFFVPEELSRVSENFQRLSSGMETGPNEYKTRAKSGESRWIQVSSQPVLEGDTIVGVQGMMMDITDRKNAEMQLKKAAATSERERLARELHDSVTQTLYSVTAIADALPRIWDRDREQAREGLGELRTLTYAALAEMRTLLLELRPESLEKQTLPVLISQLADGLMGRTRMSIILSLDENCRMPIDVQIALYRITQEALNNTVKHARASQAEVRLECDSGLVKLTISDNGVGFDPERVTTHQLGLDIMRERAQDIDADFEIIGQPDAGTKIFANWTNLPERE